MPFVAGDSLFTDMQSYCAREVEPMGREVEQVCMSMYLTVGRSSGLFICQVPPVDPLINQSWEHS